MSRDVSKVMNGVVESKDGSYFVIRTDGPPHLTILNLTPGQMAGAVVGDRVELRYTSTASYGLWNVSRVLPTT